MVSKQFVKYFFLEQCILICYQFIPTKALTGPNMRLAQHNEFPFIVSIAGLRNVTRDRIHILHRCTGSLVTRQDVITAEHCLRSRLTDGFRVLVGSRDLTQTTDYFPLFIWTYQHWAIFMQRQENYEIDTQDLAFIKLLANVPASQYIAPYGNIGNEMLYGLNVQTAGWGKFINGTKPRFLYMADLQVLSKRECEIRVSIMERRLCLLDRVRLCTFADPYIVITPGDSGGPLLYFGVIVAVNSGVVPAFDGQTLPNQLNVHVGLRYYQDFFEDIQGRFHVNFDN